mmetsp:Transcript_19248/g.32206  ORF Transcript_19248/g.32206 Transcript_19248/m.32206 type:complete len:894 (+) Transcript_19248:43-2724(+)
MAEVASLSTIEEEKEFDEGVDTANMAKEYQTLFWVPMLFQTCKNAETLIEEMLDNIQDFHDADASTHPQRKSSVMMAKGPHSPPKRRQQILGEVLDSEAVTTRVDVVLKSENTKYNLLSVLKRHFLFSQLRDYELEDVIDVMQAMYVDEGEVIIQEGDPGDLFYILEEGSCEIFIADESLGLLESGSSFGDLALMYNCPRAATIKTASYCTLWTLDRVFFRQAMVTSSSNQNVQLSQFLSKITLFESIGVQKLNQLARSLAKQSYEDGEYIIRQGDIGEIFYVIHRGTVVVSKTDDSGNENVLISLGEGEVFGEQALIKKEPRKANVVAQGPVECYYLESHDFYAMLGEFVEKFNKINEFRIIRSARAFTKLSDYRLKGLIAKLVYHRMFSGQRLVCGPGEIFLALDGQFSSTSGDTFSAAGDVQIGDIDKTADEVAGALTALSDEGVLASISKEQLVEQLAQNEQDEQRKARSLSMTMSVAGSRTASMMSLNPSGSSNASTASSGDVVDGEKEIQLTTERRRATARLRRQSLAEFICQGLDEMEMLQPLGRGTFGSVFLCRHKRTNKYMALKCLDKKALVSSGQYHYVRREIIALENFQHPFLASYFGVVLSPRKICLMLEFVSGGELWTYLYNTMTDKDRGKYGGMKLFPATLYAGTVILALEHIHGLGYSYRDMKPENLLINERGYLKLVDFGFAKQVPFINKSKTVQYRTFTLCGTPDYMAPELVLTQGHDRSIDYWSFGVLVYELLCGHTPFESSNQQRTFEKIVHSQKHLAFPPNFDPHCKSLIRRLLHPNAALRMGALQNGIDDIKNHAFFSIQNIDFEALLGQTLPMPYVPEAFDPNSGQSASTASLKIEPMDLEFELTVEVEDDFASYFHDLNSPELLLETSTA